MSQYTGVWKRCPRCGAINPPDAIYCQNCGYKLDESAPDDETRVIPPVPGTPSYQQQPVQQAQQALWVPRAAPPQPVQAVQTPAPQATAQQPGATAPVMQSGPLLPIPYRLVFPDGRYIEVYQQMRVFGREDFVGYIPEPYINYITRLSKGGQFRIYCMVKDINTIICYIRDDHSTNPTLLNNEPIRGKGWIPLKEGDVISPAGVINIYFTFAAPVSPPPTPQGQGEQRQAG